MPETRCKLCLNERPLRRSHLVPRAFYNLLRTPDMEDPRPIVADAETTRVSQEQMAQPLLCAACESRLNEHGERWVLLHSYRLDGPSPLYTALNEATPDAAFGSGTVYSTLSAPGIDLDQLAYFGASIFWRASVADWTMNRKPAEMMRLGAAYDEQFREYLLGSAPFPRNAVLWVAVVRSEHPSPVIAFPGGERIGSYHRHTFDVLGLSYILYVGIRIPEDIRRFCAVRSPERYMFFTPIDPIIERNYRNLARNSEPSPKLAEITKRALSAQPLTVKEQMANLIRERLKNSGRS
jgi:hypothetical protein